MCTKSIQSHSLHHTVSHPSSDPSQFIHNNTRFHFGLIIFFFVSSHFPSHSSSGPYLLLRQKDAHLGHGLTWPADYNAYIKGAKANVSLSFLNRHHLAWPEPTKAPNPKSIQFTEMNCIHLSKCITVYIIHIYISLHVHMKYGDKPEWIKREKKSFT